MDLSGNQGEETQVTKKRRGDKETNVGGQQPCLADPDNDGEETTQRDGENEEDVWGDYKGEEEEWEEWVSQHHPCTQSLLTDLTAEEGGGTQPGLAQGDNFILFRDPVGLGDDEEATQDTGEVEDDEEDLTDARDDEVLASLLLGSQLSMGGNQLLGTKVRGKHVGVAVEGISGAGTRPLGMEDEGDGTSEGAISTPTNTSTPITLRRSLLTDKSRCPLRPAALTNVGG